MQLMFISHMHDIVHNCPAPSQPPYKGRFLKNSL
jgi:hypothetical protein